MRGVEPEDVDLAKNMARLSRILAVTAADIVTELHTAERSHNLAGLLEGVAGELRDRALYMPSRSALPPRIIEPNDIGDSGSR